MAATTRTKLIAAAILAAIGGGAALVLTSGDEPILEIAASNNVLKVEAAGVYYGGWPEIAVIVNGEPIASQSIDSKIRKTFEFDVPSSVGAISTVEIKMTSEETDCKAARHSLPTGGSLPCTNRIIALRGLYLNDEKIEGAVAEGEKNQPWSLQSNQGGIKWEISG